jgi:hypothetical protein
MGCCRETFACCKLRCKLADLGQCLADRFRDPTETQCLCCPHFLHFVPAAKTHRKRLRCRILVMEAFPKPSRSQAHGGGRKKLRLCGRDGSSPGTGHPRQCSFPITREGDRSRRFLPLRYEPVPRGARNFEQIQRHSPRDMSLRLGPVLPRRECAAGNTGKKSCYIPKK